MAAGDLALKIILSAQDSASGVVGKLGQGLTHLAGSAMGLSTAAGQVDSSMSGLASGSGALGAIVGAGAAAATALVGVGIASTKAAADYQQTMNQVQALAGVSAGEAQAASAAIMKMATDLGQSPKTLADGLYYIASAGFSAKDSLALLELSTKAASVGNTDTTTTANALTAAMKAFNIPASGAAKVMDEMTKTVSTGKTEFADYANVIGKISLNAKQAGVSFEEANAAFATLTNVMPSSKQAADSLNALLQTSSRIDLLTSRAKALGISFDANAYKTMNLEQRLQYLMKITGGNQEEMTKLLGRQNAVAAATALATGKFGDYNTALKNITNSSGALNVAWEKTASGFNVQMGRVKAAFDVLLIAIGNQLLPVLTSIAKYVAPIISAFAQWITSSNAVGSAISSFGGKAGKTFGDLGGILGTTGAYLKDIFSLIGQAIGTVFGHDFNQAATTVGSFAKGAILALNSILFTIDELLDPIVNKVLPAFLNLRDAINGGLMTAFKAFATIIGGDIQKNFGSLDQSAAGLVPAIEAIADAMNKSAEYVKQLQPVFQDLGTFMGNTFKPVIDQMVETFNTQVKPAWNDFVESIGPALPALKLVAQIIGVVLILALKGLALYIAEFAKGTILIFGTIVQGLLIAATNIMTVIGDWVRAWEMIKAAWDAAPAFFAGIWNSIVKAFQDAWDWIVTQAKSAWRWIVDIWGGIGFWFQEVGKTLQKAVGDTWDWIKNATRTAWTAIVQTVKKPVEDIGALFQWLFQHNHYIRDLTNIIKKAFQDVLNWIVQAWTDTINWITTHWQQLSQAASQKWGEISKAVQQKTSEVITFIQDQWNRFVGWITGVWNGFTALAASAWQSVSDTFSSIWTTYISGPLSQLWTNISKWWADTQTKSSDSAKSMWKSISDVFTNAWSTYISTPMSKLWTSISGWFTKTGTDFKTWGGNLLKMMGQGITAGFHWVIDGITKLAQSIADFLGFESPPKKGPLSKSDKWMGNMIKMLADGITAGIATITKPITDLAQKIADFFGFSSPPKSGPLSKSDKWMPNMMSMLANGIITNSLKVLNPLTTLANQISTKFASISNTVTTAVNNINQTIAKLGNQLQTVTTNMMNTLNNLKNQIGTAITQINTNIGKLGTELQTVGKKIGDELKKIEKTVTDAGKTIAKGITAIPTQITSIGKQIQQKFTEIANTVNKAGQDINQKVGEMGKNLQDAAGVVNTTMTNIGNSIQQHGTEINNSVTQLRDNLGKWFQDTLNMDKEFYGKIIGDMGKTAQDVGRALQQTGQAIQQSTTTIMGNISKFGQDLMQGVGKAAQGVGESMKQMLDKTKGAGKDILDSIGQTMTTFAQTVQDKGAQVVAAAQAIATRVAALLGHSTPDTGPLKDDDLWGQHFIENIVGGIEGGLPMVTKAANMVAGALGGANIATSLSPSSGRYATPGSSQPMVINVNLDKKTIGKVATQYMQKEIHVQGGVRGL